MRYHRRVDRAGLAVRPNGKSCLSGELNAGMITTTMLTAITRVVPDHFRLTPFCDSKDLAALFGYFSALSG